jgi:DNA-binding transcriptional LysR family regulator
VVAEGVGLSTTPISTAREAERAGRIRRIRMASPPPRATLGLVYRTAAFDHPRIAMLRQALLQLPGIRLL